MNDIKNSNDYKLFDGSLTNAESNRIYIEYVNERLKEMTREEAIEFISVILGDIYGLLLHKLNCTVII